MSVEDGELIVRNKPETAADEKSTSAEEHDMITIEQFEKFPVFDGVKLCPAGNYSLIKSFDMPCDFAGEAIFSDFTHFKNFMKFGVRSVFGLSCTFVGSGFDNNCVFGNSCYFNESAEFGNGCEFGRECHFAARTHFGRHCTFGSGCWFNSFCRFGDNTVFSVYCKFLENCYFGRACLFSEHTIFDAKCVFENGYVAKSANPYMAIDRIGSVNRKAYLYNFEQGLYVRCGCFFGTEDEFVTKLRSDNDEQKEHIYLMALALAKAKFQMEEI